MLSFTIFIQNYDELKKSCLANALLILVIASSLLIFPKFHFKTTSATSFRITVVFSWNLLCFMTPANEMDIV